MFRTTGISSVGGNARAPSCFEVVHCVQFKQAPDYLHRHKDILKTLYSFSQAHDCLRGEFPNCVLQVRVGIQSTQVLVFDTYVEKMDPKRRSIDSDYVHIFLSALCQWLLPLPNASGSSTCCTKKSVHQYNHSDKHLRAPNAS